MRERKTILLTWLAGFVVFTIFGLLEFGYRYLDDLSRNHHDTFGMRLMEEMSGAYSAALLFPLVVWLARRFSFLRSRWYRVLPVHLAAMLAFAALHTSAMALSRALIAPLVHLGAYNYGIMLYRYPMEANKQIVVYGTWVLGITLFDYYREARRREVTTAELQTRLAEAQLENLRLQLHPHFLFNTLNTISSVMYDDVERADAMLTRLSDLLRRTLRPAKSQEVRLSEELSLLELYVELMRARFGDDLAVEFDIDIDTRAALVPQLILQPLVENSIRYGGDPATGRVSISITAHRHEQELLLAIADCGTGTTISKADLLRKGIGLSNTAGRLESLYGDAHEFILRNGDSGGFRAELRIPFRTETAS